LGRVALLGIAQRSIRVKFKQKRNPFSPHNQLPQSVQTLGDWIKAKRIGKKLTPGHLATKMGIASGVVCTWEDGRSRPSKEQMQDLVRIFGEVPPLGITN
jgi:DNA-binding transcriptional regulator YiaG